VSWVFWGNPQASSRPFNLLFAEAATLDKTAVRSSPTWVIPADDKGLVDFTWLAFRLFGVHLQSLNSMFFLVLVAGSCLFVADNFQRPARLALLVVLLAGLYSVTFLVHVTDQFTTLFEPRFFDVLSLIPTIHLLSIVVDRRGPSLWLVSVAAADVFLILFIYHARAAVAWEIGLLVVCNLAMWSLWGSPTSASSVSARIGGRVVSLMRLGWPSVLVVAGLLCLQGYKSLSYQALYFQKHGTSHVFWHNMMMGLACNLSLAERYRLSLADVDTIRAVEAHLLRRGDVQTHVALYGDPHCLEANFNAFDWIRYESAARDLYTEAWLQDPGEMALTYVYHKPWAFFTTLRWAMGAAVDNGTIPAALGTTADDEQRERHDLYFNPFRYEVIGLVLATFLIAFPCLRQEARKVFLLVIVTLVFSTIPEMLFLPSIPYVNTSVVLATAAIYMGTVWVCVLAMDFAKTWLIVRQCEGGGVTHRIREHSRTYAVMGVRGASVRSAMSDHAVPFQARKPGLASVNGRRR